MKEAIRLVMVAMILVCGLAQAADTDIDPRTQCEQIMKGVTKSDRSWQPVYGPCCKSQAAMASREKMGACMENQALLWLQKRGVPTH